MKFALIVFAALALGMVGCAAQEPAVEADLHGDVRFSLEEREGIERGQRWLAEQAGIPVPTIAWDEVVDESVRPNTIRRERASAEATGTKNGASGFCTAVGQRGAVYLDPVGRPEEKMTLEILPGLAAHELAHCELGFVDGYRAGDVETDGVMRVLDPMRWTEAEREQCRKNADLCRSGH